MGRKEDLQSQIEKMQEELAGMDDGDDFEIEVWEGDKGARVPYSKGKSWFERTFGIDLDADDGKGKKPARGKPAAKSDDDGADDANDGPRRPRALRHLGQQRDAS